MNSKKICTVLLVFILAGLAIFMQTLVRQEKKAIIKELHGKGNQIVSLIALHSMHDFEGDKRNVFIRTLMNYSSYQGLAYCFIDDKNGKPVVSINPLNLGSEIPNVIQTKSLNAMVLTQQSFETVRSNHRIVEFANPIIENGVKTGTVRIGLEQIFPAIFSMNRIRLLAMLTFFIISVITISYYGFLKTLTPLKQFSKDILNHKNGEAAALNNTSTGFTIGSIIENFQQSLAQLKDNLKKIEKANEELTSRIGVLRFEKNQAMNIFNAVNLGIIITDLQGNVGHINNYLLNLFGSTRDDVIDRPLEEFIQDQEIMSFISREETLEQQRPNSHIDIMFPELAPGETYRVSYSHLKDSGKTFIGKMIMFNNVTKEKEAGKATQDFTAHLSHELLTPLTTIKSYSEMLMDDEIQDNETKKEFYNTINSETTRLSRLIKDLLNLSKIEMGSLTLNKGLVKSDWLFEDCIAAVEGTARKKSISIHRHLPNNFPSLVGDKDQLKSAIINILGNAVKYTPDSGEIHFELSEHNGMVVFDIKDTGHGMSEEDLSRIFEKFYRSQNPQIAAQQGTGLGLAITSEIIGLHDGEIKVKSELGKGTHFTVKIPKEKYYLGK